eukprot:TRINITY_DN2393_c0_g1_i1.p1 TRINITY_DN2393_c0_g1~~TRINITY_DN2393_c0_g1_i1.p1  ORF type:complete len:264 (-),score=25.23 TRINITY_DN2393_c0_g1_i1:1811-2602(-)
MAVAIAGAVISLTIVPCAIYLATRSELRRQQMRWRRQGPLDPSQGAERRRGRSTTSQTWDKSLQLFVADLQPPSSLVPGMDGGIRCYDPFIVIQVGHNVQRSRNIEGCFHSSREPVPFSNAPFLFPLPSTDSVPTAKAFLYGRKYEKSTESQRLMAVGTIPLKQVLEKGLPGISVPLRTRTDRSAGFLRIVFRREVNLPELFIADEPSGSFRIGGSTRFFSGRKPTVAFSANHEAVLAVPDFSPARSDGGSMRSGIFHSISMS